MSTNTDNLMPSQELEDTRRKGRGGNESEMEERWVLWMEGGDCRVERMTLSDVRDEWLGAKSDYVWVKRQKRKKGKKKEDKEEYGMEEASCTAPSERGERGS